MLLIICKVKLKPKWTKYGVLFTAGVGNTDANPNNVIFKIKDANLYVPVVTLTKQSKLFCKGFEKSVYWNEYKTKSETKSTRNEYRYFLESNFVGVN